jgi:hypothetical protein
MPTFQFYTPPLWSRGGGVGGGADEVVLNIVHKIMPNILYTHEKILSIYVKGNDQ